MASIKLDEDYWNNFRIRDQDIEFLYNHLLETETPLTTDELLGVLLTERVRLQKIELEAQKTQGAQVYFPKDHFLTGQELVFPALNWQKGAVVQVRNGNNPDIGQFEVIKVKFTNGTEREFAAGLVEHMLNETPQEKDEATEIDVQEILKNYG
ncbi:MAG: hypothetical protein ACPL3P_04310, partial [Anaerolineales bacterium]